MEFESKLAERIAGRTRTKSGSSKKVIAFAFCVVMAASTMALIPSTKAAMVLVDEVNIGEVSNEGDRLVGWSGVWMQGSSPGGWGGFDADDPYGGVPRGHNLRTVWYANDENWATVTFTPSSDVKLIEIRALDGLADDSFAVFINDKPVYGYGDMGSTETWKTHEIPVKSGGGQLVVKIMATAPAWGGLEGWGQLGINWIRLYGMSGFDLFGYNYNARLFVGTYDGSDRYLDGKYWAATGDYVDDAIVMKWSEAWDQARFYGAEWTSEAWCTNHVVGDYLGDDGAMHQYTWFVKIVWVGPGGDLWGEFTVVEEIYNDPYSGYHGLQYKSEPGPGLGGQ